MKNLSNVQTLGIDNNSIMKLLNLYTYKGKDFYYENLLKSDLEAIERKTIKTELITLADILKLDITEARKKTILKKDVECKNKDEQMFTNLKNIFTNFLGNYKNFEFDTNEFLMLVKTLYDNVDTTKYRTYKIKGSSIGFLNSTQLISMRDELDLMLKIFKEKDKSNKFEITNLIINFYLDFKKQEIFTKHNDLISLIVLYMMLFVSGFTLFRYTSFFKIYTKYSKEFEAAELKAYFNYDKGFSDSRELDELIINILLEGYNLVEDYINTYKFDIGNTKSNNIMGIIYKLPQEFSKDDIRKQDPLTSDSTINRTLQKLQKEKKIRSIGYGRNAKWLRIQKDPIFNSNLHQINLFELNDSDNNK